MYKIRLSPEAKSQLKKLKIIHKDAIASVIEDLKEDPYLGKPLGRELSRRYSYRVGVYRVIYKIIKEDSVVEVLSAGHRSVVYN
mgnify:CR=1 FL=1